MRTAIPMPSGRIWWTPRLAGSLPGGSQQAERPRGKADRAQADEDGRDDKPTIGLRQSPVLKGDEEVHRGHQREEGSWS